MNPFFFKHPIRRTNRLKPQRPRGTGCQLVPHRNRCSPTFQLAGDHRNDSAKRKNRGSSRGSLARPSVRTSVRPLVRQATAQIVAFPVHSDSRRVCAPGRKQEELAGSDRGAAGEEGGGLSGTVSGEKSGSVEKINRRTDLER